jgi:glutamate--cysteine ligase
MTQQLDAPVFSPEIRSTDDLEHYFHAGSKERREWRIGVEYEKPVVFTDTADAVPYEGPRGIGALLRGLEERYDWEPVHEDGNLIALRDDKASITLEPGGQLEMSGQQCDSLHCAADELHGHVEEILSVGDSLGLKFLGLGITPKTPIARMPWMPKQRYRIMREIMSRTGRLGHRMMQQTATVQANFDYSGEADARRKFRLAMAMSPVLVAISANSPIVDGQPSGYKSYRAHIWRDTDPARCGLLPFAFDTQNVFGAYASWALDVPMYFLWRDGRFVEARGITFRQFLEKGLNGHRATLADWATHLTTLFPEARLKTYLEVRAADSQPVELMLGTPALMKGLLYDDDCLEAAWDVLRPWTLEERYEASESAARDGLDTRVHRHRMRDFALELVGIASEGLHRQARRNGRGEDEAVHLAALARDVEHGVSPADRVLRAWYEGGEQVAALVADAAYRAP